jgi:type VI secretion system protein ImpK
MNKSWNPLLPHLEQLIDAIVMIQSSKDLKLELRQRLMQLISQFERAAQSSGSSHQSITMVKFAMVALIDEQILQKETDISDAWAANPLQLEYFGEIMAGEQFFTRLDEMRLQGELNVDALEVMYLCIELGFQGQYRHANQTALIKLKHELLHQIVSLRPSHHQVLSIEYQHPDKKDNQTQPNMLSKWALGCIAAIGLIFVTYSGVISYKAHQAREVIISYQDALKS